MKSKILCLSILMLTFAYGAQASLIDLGILDIPGLGNPTNELNYIINNFDPDPTTYLQKWNTDGTGFAQNPGTGSYTFDPDGNVANMDITWDLTGTGFGLDYVLVKDGNTGSGNKFYHLYRTTADQRFLSGGAQSITINDDKGISHVSFFGSAAASVPDASIMLLLGSSLLGLGVFSRKRKRRS